MDLISFVSNYDWLINEYHSPGEIVIQNSHIDN